MYEVKERLCLESGHDHQFGWHVVASGQVRSQCFGAGPEGKAAAEEEIKRRLGKGGEST